VPCPDQLRRDRTFFYYGGANDLFSLSDLDLAQLDSASIVHVGGTYLLPRFDGEGAARLFAEARKREKLTSMDVTWDTTGRWLTVIEPCLPYLSFFMPSIREAEKNRRQLTFPRTSPLPPGEGRADRGHQAR